MLKLVIKHFVMTASFKRILYCLPGILVILIVQFCFVSCENQVQNKDSTIEEDSILGIGIDRISKDTLEIKKQVDEAITLWVESWNGRIDPDKMLSAYHKEHKYIWRGAYPYSWTKEGIEDFFVGQTNYQLTYTEPDYTFLSPEIVIAFFHFKDSNGDDYGSGAATLVITKIGEEWKVKYVHESSVEDVGSE